MCFRFAAQLQPALVRHVFRTSNPLPNVAPNWNVVPMQRAMVVRRHPKTGERHLDAMRCELVP